MVALQSAMGVQALVLGLLTVTGDVKVWEIGVLAVLLGLNNAFENPARQSFMLELVGARAPAQRGLPQLGAGQRRPRDRPGGRRHPDRDRRHRRLLPRQRRELRRRRRLADDDGHDELEADQPPTSRAADSCATACGTCAARPSSAVPLMMMAAVGCLTYEFQVSLPVMASRALHAGAAGFGFMTAAMGVGAVAGGLLVAARGRTGLRPLVLAATGFGVAMGLAALAPTLALELVVLALVGAASISFMSTGNSTLQLGAAPEMRGRVMSLWFVAFQGSTPVGGPIVGATMAWPARARGSGSARSRA